MQTVPRGLRGEQIAPTAGLSRRNHRLLVLAGVVVVHCLTYPMLDLLLLPAVPMGLVRLVSPLHPMMVDCLSQKLRPAG